MDVEPVYNETMAERMDFERKPIGGMDTDIPSFDTAQRMFESANNGSKNGSKVCVPKKYTWLNYQSVNRSIDQLIIHLFIYSVLLTKIKIARLLLI